jgi:hypothetical protein
VDERLLGAALDVLAFGSVAAVAFAMGRLGVPGGAGRRLTGRARWCSSEWPPIRSGTTKAPPTRR